jgi:hypothetical protein
MEGVCVSAFIDPSVMAVQNPARKRIAQQNVHLLNNNLWIVDPTHANATFDGVRAGRATLRMPGAKPRHASSAARRISRRSLGAPTARQAA